MKVLCSFVVILVCLEGVLSQILFNDTNTRIIGGLPIQITQAPYQIALTRRVNNQYSFMCGGSLLSPTLVVTAAHCLVSGTTLLPASTLRVFAGITQLTEVVTTFSDAEWTKIHEGYYETSSVVHNDIGLIKLKSKFSLNNKISTIALSTAVVTNTTSNCSISGWGSTSMNGPTSNELRRASVPIFDKATCNKNYQNLLGVPLHNGTICAGLQAGGVDSCQGDSGGPLVCNNLLTGVVSYGYGCGLPNYPGIYTDVRQYKAWVEKNGASSISPIFIVTLLVQIISYAILKS